jgi:hypothetical protein
VWAVIVYYDEDRRHPEARLHPYAGKQGESGYVDFKLHPELIRVVLEDFRRFDYRGAIQRFYAMLEWINGSGCKLETNDSAFRPPSEHQDRNSNLRLSTHGRLCVLYRALQFNSSPEHAKWLCNQTMVALSRIDDTFSANEGVVGFTRNPILQTALSTGRWITTDHFESSPGDPGLGELTMMSFWAYGTSDDEAFENLSRAFSNVWEACRLVSADIERATA